MNTYRAYRSPPNELHYGSVVNAAADLAQFVHQRELMAYQSRLARVAYAYGVDLRRSAWLESSSVGEPLMRAVDRRWTELVQALRSDVLRPDTDAAPSFLLEELMRLIKLLRAPRPTVRLLRANVDERLWPAAIPIGTTKGGAHWLLLDPDRLLALSPTERTFILASTLANLQCDHGPVFAAHLIAYRRRRGLTLVRPLLAPWATVGSFSSDRAALLAIGELEPTQAALHLHGQPAVAWWPKTANMRLRVQALEDFDRSRVMTRLRIVGSEEWSLEPKPEPNVEGIRNAAETPINDAAPTPPPPPTHASSSSSSWGGAVAEAEAEAERLHAVREATELEREAAEQRTAAQKADEERLLRAWPLSRCDERLTRRLGLL